MYIQVAADNLFVVDVYTKIENLGSESKVIHMFPDFLQFKMEKIGKISILRMVCRCPPHTRIKL